MYYAMEVGAEGLDVKCTNERETMPVYMYLKEEERDEDWE